MLIQFAFGNDGDPNIDRPEDLVAAALRHAPGSPAYAEGARESRRAWARRGVSQWAGESDIDGWPSIDWRVEEDAEPFTADWDEVTVSADLTEDQRRWLVAFWDLDTDEEWSEYGQSVMGGMQWNKGGLTPFVAVRVDDI